MKAAPKKSSRRRNTRPPQRPATEAPLSFALATPAKWPDIERLFGERGACGGCWCMFWRLKRSEFDSGKGARNKRAFKQLVTSGGKPGVLAYAGKEPVGWCAFAPRHTYSALERSRILKPVDGRPVWSISCFFVARPFRRRGISVELLKAAVDFASRRGAAIVEGYPTDARAPVPDAFVWTGLSSAFREAGFREVTRRSNTRPIMRYLIDS